MDGAENASGPAVALLDKAERVRLRQFGLRTAAHRFAFRRAVRRVVLASYLGVEPAALRFFEGKRGKPQLDDPYTRLQFNASDSGDIGVIAVASATPVGSDVEVKRTIAYELLASKILSKSELAWYRRTLDEEQRKGVIQRIWSLKEAILKGIGVGLDLGLFRTITVPCEARGGTWYSVGREQRLGASEPWYALSTDLPEDSGASGIVSIASTTRLPVTIVSGNWLMAKFDLVR